MGPTRAVEIEISSALISKTLRVTLCTSTPKLTALSLSNQNTSSTRC
ncbi:Uncharacterised protein [Vibrio cholerae]|nr:Uncharacterised protein [Vibrio cholerae]